MKLTLICVPGEQWEILYGDNQKLKESKSMERNLLIRSSSNQEWITVTSMECKTLTQLAWEKWKHAYPDSLDSFHDQDFVENT